MNNSATVNPISKMLLVLLRIAIGWHICYEGLGKIDPHWLSLSDEVESVAKPWSAEMYLRNSSGPLRGYFREIVDDAYGMNSLGVDDVGNPKIFEVWDAQLADAKGRFSLDAEQDKAVSAVREKAGEQVKAYLSDPDTKAKVDSYLQAVDAWRQKSADSTAIRLGTDPSEQAEWKSLDATRRSLIGPIDGWTKQIDAELAIVLTPEQAKRDIRLPLSWEEAQKLSQLEQVNLTTMWGLTIFGGFMIVGLFSRLSSLGAAVLLGLFYFAMPPWPGLPPNPVVEGHYLFINKTFIEMMACLVLATFPTGVWGGLDALVRGMITRPLFGVGAKEIQGVAAE